MTFNVAADAYDRFMGQYSSQLSVNSSPTSLKRSRRASG